MSKKKVEVEFDSSELATEEYILNSINFLVDIIGVSKVKAMKIVKKNMTYYDVAYASSKLIVKYGKD